MTTPNKPIRLLIFDDNDDMRESLSILFNGTEGILLTGALADVLQVLEDVKANAPDVILMDIDMPKVNGMEAVWQVKKQYPDVQILMLTVFDDNDHVFRSICAGASGYILKRTPPEKIVEAVFDMASGGGSLPSSIARKVLDMFPRTDPSQNETETLTVREREVLALLVKGHSYKMAGAELNITLETIRSHIKKIYQKLHVHNSGEAIALALRNRLV
jgi:DNA-binding NarL/FixJ family response regulator